MRAFEHIMATAHLQLVEKQPDFFPQLKFEWDVTGGTTMPSSPVVYVYRLTTDYIPYEIVNNEVTVNASLKYSTEVQWAKHTGTLVKLIDPEQIWHRSRDVAIAIDSLRINEMQHRINQVTEWYNEYKKYALNERQSWEVSQIIRDETRSALRLNFDWIQSYIREHVRSSLGGGGYKWRQALDITRGEWKEVLDLLVTNTEEMEAHPDWYVANFPRTGERARANNIDTIKHNYQGEINRTRVITFGNHMSLWTVFIPDKATWYTKVLTKVADVIKPAGEYYYPYMEGGHIYRRFSDMHKTKYQYHALDGKSWDAGAGIILGKYVNCYLVPIGGIPQVASGESHTSMLDTVAMQCATRLLTGTKIILGDDCAHWGNLNMHTPWLEQDAADTKYMFNLGVSYSHDQDAPRISGIKITKDRGKDMISINTGEFQAMTGVYGGRHSPEERALHAGMYLGRFGKGTLLERIEHIPPGEFMSPTELMEEIMEEGTVDALEWARERGITEVFA